MTTTISTTINTNQTTTLKPEPTTTIITKSQPTSHVKLASNKQESIITIITQPKLDSLQAPSKETTQQVRTINPQSQSPNQTQPLQTRSQVPKKKKKLQRKNYKLKSKQPSIKIQLLLSPRKSVRKLVPHKLPLKPNKQQGRKKPQQKKIHRQTKQREKLNQPLLLNKKPLHNQKTQQKRKLQRKRPRSHSQRQPRVKQGTIRRRKPSSRRNSPNRMGQVQGSTYTKTTITPDSVAWLPHSENSLPFKSSMTPEIRE